jgi:parallel beta-helix repeat protein
MALGQKGSEITFTSSNPDRGTAPNLWNGIVFGNWVGATARANQFTYCIFKNATLALHTEIPLILVLKCQFYYNAAVVRSWWGNTTAPHAVILGSTITANTISISGGPGWINLCDAAYNNIFNNDSGADVFGVGGGPTYAPNNWWGAFDGPGPVGPGSGNWVASNVIYSPWLTAPVDDFDPSPITSIKLFKNKYSDELSPGDTIGMLENLYISIEAGDPSTESYSLMLLLVTSESFPGGMIFPAAEVSEDSGGLFNGRLRIVGSGSQPLCDEIHGNILAIPGNKIYISVFSGGSGAVSIPVSSVGTWEVSDNPQDMYGFPLSLPSGSTLHVNPGVTVDATYNSKLLFNGVVMAKGDTGNKITFTSGLPSPSVGSWQGMEINGAGSKNSTIEYAAIEYATDPLYISSSSPTIKNCSFSNNQPYAIYAYGGSFPKILSNYITSTSGGSGYGCIDISASSAEVRGNTIVGNTCNAIRVTSGSPKLTVIGNTIANNLNGVLLGSGLIKANILNNSIYNSPSPYSNIMVSSMAAGSSIEAHRNNLYNELASTGTMSAWNKTTITIEAQDNWWGSPTGPYHPTKNPGGNPLSSVSNYVNFDSWEDATIESWGPVASNFKPPDKSATNDAYVRVSVDIESYDGVDTSTISMEVNGTTYLFPDHLTFSSGVLTFTPTTPFSPDGTAEVSLNSASDVLGYPLQNPYTWEFLVDTATPEFTGISVTPEVTHNGTVNITANFFDALSGMDTFESPSVWILTPLGTTIEVFELSYTGITWEGIATVETDVPNGIATVEVRGAKDIAGNFIVPSLEAAHFEIDMPPPAPSDLTGEAVSTEAIRWYWKDNSVSEDGFHLLSAEGGELILTAEANSQTTDEAGLLSNTIYSRSIEAFNSAGSNASSPAFVCTWALAPYNLISPAQTPYTITLTWESDGSSYEVERATDEGGIFGSLGTTFEMTFIDPGLDYGTTYWYRLFAYNKHNIVNPNFGGTIEVTTPSTPIPPSWGFSFEGTAQTTSEILWSWSSVEVIESYILISFESGINLKQVDRSLTATLEAGLLPNTRYERYAVATNEYASISSETDAVYTLATRPHDLFISSPIPYSALITWESDATSYEVQRATTTEMPLESQWTPNYAPTYETAYLDAGLSADTVYWYRIIGYNGDGISTEPSFPISILSIEGTSGTPESPTDFFGTAESTGLILWMWRDNSFNEWGYNLRRYQDNNIMATRPADSTYEVESVPSPNTAYARYVEVFAATFNGRSGTDEVYTLATVPGGVISATQELNSISISWEGDGTSYAIEKSLASAPYVWEFITGETFASALTTTEYKDSPLGPGLRYFYRVSAYNGDGRLSSPSEIISAETSGTPDTTPPTIRHIRFNGRAYFRNDVIRDAPTITATISDEVPGIVYSISIEANGFSIYRGRITDGWIDQTGNGTASYNPITGAFGYTLNPARALGTPPANYTITIQARDPSGNSTQEVCFVRVYGGEVQVIGPALTVPVPFKALPAVRGEGEPLRIVYTLTLNADVAVYMYDISGQMIMTRKYSAGFEGGRAGYNEVQWNGWRDGGGVVGNGIYIYRIISGRRVLATGKVVVLD